MEEHEIPMRPVWHVLRVEEDLQLVPAGVFGSLEEANSYRNLVAERVPGGNYEIRESLSVVPDRVLPDRSQIEELGTLLQHAFVAIRQHARESGSAVIEDIADAFHNVPTEMFKLERWDWNLLELSLRELASRHSSGLINSMPGMLRQIRNNGADLVKRAEEEIGAAKGNCLATAHAPEAMEALWQVFTTCFSHPEFTQRCTWLRVTVLNELSWLLSDPQLRPGAWDLIRGLAFSEDESDPLGMKDSLRIAIFECAAEAPEVPYFLELLFSLAGDQHTRWAVFAAYENVPWRLRPHAHRYSNGQITDADCDQWLEERGLGPDEFLMGKQPITAPHGSGDQLAPRSAPMNPS